MGDEDEMPSQESQELPIMNQKLKTIEKPEMDEDFPAELSQRLDNVQAPASLLGER